METFIMHPEISLIIPTLIVGWYPKTRYYGTQLDLGRAADGSMIDAMNKKLGIADLRDYVGILWQMLISDS